MTYTQDDYAILSLVVRIPRQQDTEHPPLDLKEYNQLVAVLLKPLESTPAGLYSEEIRSAVEEHLPTITAQRTQALTEDRRHTIALLLEQMESMGITVVTRRMDTYPRHLKEKLGAAAPPCLYICGASEIADTGGIGIVGSRNPSDAAAEFARQVARTAIQAELPVVSGGAKGIDSIALNAALKEEALLTAVLPGDMARTTRTREVREAIDENRALVISAVHPEAGFSVGNAMGRNRLIYGLSRATAVISSDDGKGGTWSGATEALRRGWGPVFVRIPAEADDAPGNAGLVQKGAVPVSDPEKPFWENAGQSTPDSGDAFVQQDLFGADASEDGPESRPHAVQ